MSQKLEVIKFFENGVTVKETMKKFNIAKSTAYLIITNKASLNETEYNLLDF